MLTEPQAKFIDALLSDEFEQGQNTLRSRENGVDKFCCLGVGCEIFRRMTGRGNWSFEGGDSPQIAFMITELAHESSEMPIEVANFFGLDDGNPTLHDRFTAVVLNDRGSNPDREVYDPWSFAMIAEGFRNLFMNINADRIERAD